MLAASSMMPICFAVRLVLVFVSRLSLLRLAISSNADLYNIMKTYSKLKLMPRMYSAPLNHLKYNACWEQYTVLGNVKACTYQRGAPTLMELMIY